MRKRWYLKHDSGQDLVEYALIFPVIFLLILGLIEFSVIVFSYNTISNAAREGARYLVVHTGDATWKQDAEDKARGRAMALAQCQPLEVTAELGSLNSATCPGSDTVCVEVTCDYNLLFGYIIQAVGGHSHLQLHTVATMRSEQG